MTQIRHGRRARNRPQPTGFTHYVCDKCGNLYHQQSASDCPACGHEAVWEFTDRRNAEQHARRIRDGNASGLFRTRA